MSFLRAVAVVLYASVASVGFAQVQATTFGSAEHYRAIREMQLRAAEERAHWMTAKKLHRPGEVVFPGSPRHTLGIEEIVDGILTQNLDDGAIGYLEAWPMTVQQVISPTEVMVNPANRNLPDLWVIGCPTEGIVDEESVRVIGLVKFDGTRSYETVSGAKRTVRVARVLSAEEEREYMVEEKRREEESLYRVWTAAKGGFSTEAIFVDFSDGKVILRKRDRSVIEVNPSHLSRKDQDYYRDVLKKRREAKAE